MSAAGAERQKQAQIALHRTHADGYARVRRELVGTRLVNEYWNEEIYKWLPQRSDLAVLDNMCGTGVFLDVLARDFRFVVGADISIDMVRRTREDARKSLKGLVCADADRLPFADAFFDVVNVRGALHHVNPVDTALKEMRRVLRPGGMVIISEPCDDFILVRKMRELMYSRMNYFDEDERTFLSADLISALQRTGFRVRSHKRFGFLAYALLGYPDIIPQLEFMSRLPFSRVLSQTLIAIDKLLARTPIVKNWSLVFFVSAERA
jgi:ubiquinone/menaquinone biosynthesis C-methylase UbiE